LLPVQGISAILPLGGLCYRHLSLASRGIANRCGERGRYDQLYRCRACNGYYTLLTGTVFAKPRQGPATLVLLLHGVTKGEPTARLARELGRFRKQFHTRRRRLEANLHETTPTDVMTGTAVEAGETVPEGGEKQHAAS
jgi:transposase-like protein